MSERQELTSRKTSREKAAATRQRNLEALPGAHFRESGLQLIIPAGKRKWMEIRVRSDEWEYLSGGSKWRWSLVDLGGDLPALAGLIKALTSRYNAIVRELNATPEHMSMEHAREFTEGKNRP